ncbi:hypothetical protein E4L96_21970 [Massilia arenosa]|uniref:Big-1 domain-containing protein n=1 Tax=Zemynaea arenosa TaxID=2561931 RepID=A0A4Y9RQV4_9BURK|nr:Ig-like domain-containing protein [Massilia arenosa]TFW11282.1 hypothetical protein E4L96_21970 [Massilia arenosa]
MRTRLSPSALRVTALLAAAGLCACVSSTAPDAPSPVSLVLGASSTAVTPGTSADVELTAQVRDAEGHPVPGVRVQFGADRGAVQVLTGVTDSFGTATARLGSIGETDAHLVTATARTRKLSAWTMVRVGNPVATL